MLRYALAVAAVVSISGCDNIPLGNTTVTPKQLCSSERPHCAPDGEYYSIFSEPRPSVARIAEGTSWRDRWEDHLGRLVPPAEKLKDIPKGQKLDTNPCLTVTSDDISQDFTNIVDVDLVKAVEVKAAIDQSIQATLKNIDLANKPEIIEHLTVQVHNKLSENAYAKAHYKIFNISRRTLDQIALAKDTDGVKWQCREKIKNREGFLIRSIAVIESEGKMNSNQVSEISSLVSTELKNAKLSSGAPLAGDVSAKLSLEIASKTEEAISVITENHSNVYAYGYWGPDFATPSYTKPEFNKVLDLTTATRLRLQEENQKP